MSLKHNKEESRNFLGLLACERGAIMVMGLFMAIFLVAILYVMIGIGETLVKREGMQDASDAAAYSAAIFHARGMNLIVLINLLMAALLAILVTLRVAQTVMTVVSVICGLLVWPTLGVTAPCVPLTQSYATTLGNFYRASKEPIFKMIEGLHKAQEAIAVLVPSFAMVDGMIEAAKHHPPAEGAFALPGSFTLPVVDGEFSYLCGKAGEMVGGILVAPLGFVPEAAKDVLKEGAKEIAQAASGYLCGDGTSGSSPPQYEQEMPETFPKSEELETCKEEIDGEPTAECKRAAADAEQALPNSDGECKSDCGPHGMYEKLSRQTRIDCDPKTRGPMKTYTWQQIEGSGTLEYDGQRWNIQTLDWEESTLKPEATDPPCGRGGTVSSDEWNADSGPPDGDAPLPVCRSTQPLLPTAPREGSTIRVDFTEARRIFSCNRTISRSYPVAEEGDSFAESRGGDRTPFQLDDVKMGSEAFQIRAVAVGPKPGSESAHSMVELAVHSPEDRSDPSEISVLSGAEKAVTEVASLLGRLSVAQAEYYFRATRETSHEDRMWNMNWTARLKHFRLPSEEEEEAENERRQNSSRGFGNFDPSSLPSTSESACQKGGGSASCGDTESQLSTFDDWIKH